MKSYTILKKALFHSGYEQVQVTEPDHVDEYEVEYTAYLDAIERKIATTRDLSDLETELEDALIFEGDSIVKRLTKKEANFVESLGYTLKRIKGNYFEISASE